MKLHQSAILIFASAAASGIALAQFPQTEISNSRIHAKLYLPDATSGYYRATRFDWAGVIASLEWKGHNYFGRWFDRYDPKLHDAITGPVEEFLTNNSGLGYDEVKPGENFVRIGVGAIRKPDEPAFERFKTYEIVDAGKRSVRQGADWIEFTHELGDTGGYAYVYRKKLRLNGDRLVLEHHLRNTGRKLIATSVYDHNFFMLDGQPSGPELAVRFHFPVRSKPAPSRLGFDGLAEIRENELAYLRELKKGETVFSDLEGYGASAKDYDFRVENRKTGAGVRQTGDHAIARLLLWSIRSNISPEAYIDLKIAPGSEASWRIVYHFYELPHKRGP